MNRYIVKLIGLLAKVGSKQKWILILVLFCGLSSNSGAYNSNWVEGGIDGASRRYYNSGAKLAWKNYMGDWVDATGMPQGLSPYSQAFIAKNNAAQQVEWEITNLVNEWLNGTFQNQGLLLHVLAGKGECNFKSREYDENIDHGPKLEIILDDGEKFVIQPEADTYLEPATFKSIGGKSLSLKISSEPKGNNVLIRFPLAHLSGKSIYEAKLKLTVLKQFGGNILIGVFRCTQESISTQKLENGIAKDVIDDTRIENHRDVIFSTGFEENDWQQKWSGVAKQNCNIVSSDSDNMFSPFSGKKALRIKLLKDSHIGGGLRYKFQEKIDHEPEKIFFRYYLRLGDNWNQTVSGGKLPGFRGTYNKAGWGGRKPNGFDGWSARGLFLPTVQEKSNPLYGMTPIGFYAYYADQPGQYGEHWVWEPGKAGFPVRNKWFCIEQYVEMNTPGKKNGTLKAWINGYKVFEKKDILFRLSYNLKIEQVVLVLYHGGKKRSPYEQHLYIDNVVIAKKYIGPVNSSRVKK